MDTIEKISATELRITKTPPPVVTIVSVDALNAERDGLLRQIKDLLIQNDFEVVPRQARIGEIDALLVQVSILPVVII